MICRFGLIVVLFSLFTPSIYSQFGVSSFYKFSSSTGLMEAGQDITHSSIDFRLNYWMRLKNIRMEFLPEIIYRQHDVEPSRTFTEWAFAVPTQFYILDFISDCNCPTFSKQNEFVKKGWFLSLVPEYGILEVDNSSVSSLKIGLGTGIDIGVSDLITISPNITGLYQILSSEEIELPQTQFFAGIRVLFRPDYKSFR